MLKKFVSYVIIFSILSADAAHCGGIWGKEDREDDVPSSAIVKRQATDFSDSATGESTEDTRLVQAGGRNPNSSDTFSSEPPTPVGSFDFQAFSENPLEKRFSGWEKSHPRSSDEEEQKVEGLTLLETSDEEGASISEGLNQETDPDGVGLPQTPHLSHTGKWVKIEPTNGKRTSVNAQAFSINQGGGASAPSSRRNSSHAGSLQELGSFLEIDTSPLVLLDFSNLDMDDLSPETQEFLRYVKVRVVDGKLNWKQGLGILGGVAMSASAILTLYIIFNGEVINALFETVRGSTRYIFDYREIISKTIIAYVSFATLEMIPRINSFFVEAFADNINSFSIKKNFKHRSALLLAKSCLYAGSLLAGLLPVSFYYSVKNYYPYPETDTLRTAGAYALMLDTTLHYGHHLSHHAESWINAYFSHKTKEESPLTEAGEKRKKYLSIFADIKKFFYGLDKNKTNTLYTTIFNKDMIFENKNLSSDHEELNIREAVYVLQAFENFHQSHVNTVLFDTSKHWKVAISSKAGWCLSLLASVGRHIVFWRAFDEVLEIFMPPELETLRSVLSIILGGCLAGLTQGYIEKDATQNTVYDMLGGEKTSKATSHGFLRRSIMLWNSCLATIGAIPYIATGLYVIFRDDCTPEDENNLCWPLWAQIACFVPFGLVHTYVRAESFNSSFFSILNGFDSLMSYCYPFQGYKRDKLVSMARQLRKLFKNLDTDVLETVNQLLNPNSREQQENEVPSPLLEEEFV